MTPPASSIDAAAINQSHCGACHAPFDAKSHPRAHLERILKIHKDQKRATLTDEEWTKLIAFLAND